MVTMAISSRLPRRAAVAVRHVQVGSGVDQPLPNRHIGPVAVPAREHAPVWRYRETAQQEMWV